MHAEGQIASFTLKKAFPLEKLHHTLNCLLPKEIRVVDIFFGNFYPIKKEYHYFVETREIQSPFNRFQTWHYPYPLNKEIMLEKASALIGEKDFAPFQNSGRFHSTTIRNLETISITGEGLYHFTLIGNSFLYKMVRNIVGSLVYAGRKKPNHGRYTAPAHGLTLKRVYYDLKK